MLKKTSNQYIEMIIEALNNSNKSNEFMILLNQAIDKYDVESPMVDSIKIYFDDVLKTFNIYSLYNHNYLQGYITEIYELSKYDVIQFKQHKNFGTVHKENVQNFIQSYYQLCLKKDQLKEEYENQVNYIYKMIIHSYSFQALRYLNIDRSELLDRMNHYTNLAGVKQLRFYNEDLLNHFIAMIHHFFEKDYYNILLQELNDLNLSNRFNYNLMIKSDYKTLSNLSSQEALKLSQKVDQLLFIYNPKISISNEMITYYNETNFKQNQHIKPFLKKLIKLNKNCTN